MDKGYYDNFDLDTELSSKSQSTIKMDKGYYKRNNGRNLMLYVVAIHNKNGQGLLHDTEETLYCIKAVAIHNKNGQGLLR